MKKERTYYNIIAIIPARGGSKGIPNKNIKNLAGKPLIAYTIKSALNSKYIDRVIVSTDDEEIAAISQSYGAEIVTRPSDLALDSSPLIDTIFHAVKWLKNDYDFEIVVLLQPTSPLRTTNDIDSSIQLFLKRDCTSVISVCDTRKLYWSLKLENGYLIPFFKKKYVAMRRQHLPQLFMPNGAIFISTLCNIYNKKSFYTERIIPYIMPLERSIDIDTDIDFMLAEQVIIKKNNI